jgi:hypothetical protein
MNPEAVDLAFQSLRQTADRQTDQWRLNEAIYEAKRVASFRRALGGVLMVLGTPVVIFSRSTDPTIKHALTILAFVWVALVLPMVRLLFLEWHNRRRTDDLRGLVSGAREP